MSDYRKRFTALKRGPLADPPESGKISVGWRVRNRVFRNFRHKVVYGHLPVIPRLSVELAVFALASLVAAVLLYGLLPFISDVVCGKSPTLCSGVGVFAIIPSIIALWVLIFVLLSIVVRFMDFLASFIGRDYTRKERRKFNTDYAKHWSETTKDAITHCAKDTISTELEHFHSDKVVPYRILEGFLPVPIFRLRRPADAMEKAKRDGWLKQRDQRLFYIDALAGGVLYMLGMNPSVRFSGDSELVHDVFWRPDNLEVPDADQSDIFLRFHQSTVELPRDTTCYYKSFAALNNHRKVPILLLTVKDVLDCLTNKDGAYDDHYGKLFSGITAVQPGEILDALQRDKFRRYPPRLDRAAAGKYDEYRDGPILEKGNDGDWTMTFDPARVWVVENAGPKYIQALVVLRAAIYLAAREKSVGVVLKKRDLLIIDNRRVLVARQEDSPGTSWRDRRASWHNSLAGRWLRKIYGFPPEGEPRVPDNFTKVSVLDNDGLRDIVEPQTAQAGDDKFEHLANSLDEPCGDVAFDYGLSPENWPDFLQTTDDKDTSS